MGPVHLHALAAAGRLQRPAALRREHAPRRCAAGSALRDARPARLDARSTHVGLRPDSRARGMARGWAHKPPRVPCRAPMRKVLAARPIRRACLRPAPASIGGAVPDDPGHRLSRPARRHRDGCPEHLRAFSRDVRRARTDAIPQVRARHDPTGARVSVRHMRRLSRRCPLVLPFARPGADARRRRGDTPREGGATRREIDLPGGRLELRREGEVWRIRACPD